MPSMDIQIKKDNTWAVQRSLEKAIGVALEEVGLVAAGYAKKKCAVDTGYLRNSICHGVSGSRFVNTWTDDHMTKGGSVSGTMGSEKDHYAFIGTNVEYAAYVEFGTSRTAAQPFIKPAVNDHINQYKTIIKNRLQNA